MVPTKIFSFRQLKSWNESPSTNIPDIIDWWMDEFFLHIENRDFSKAYLMWIELLTFVEKTQNVTHEEAKQKSLGEILFWNEHNKYRCEKNLNKFLIYLK